MTTWVRRHKRHVAVSYWRSFRLHHPHGAGFAFPCDEHGVVNEAELNPYALDNYQGCLRGQVDGRPVFDVGVEKHVYHWTEWAVIKCERCGREVSLDDSVASTCECGAEYNLSGQLLAPRSQWGADTGESLADIVGPYDPSRDY